MSRSRARKNRFKYKTLRRIGFFKVFVMNYPNSSGNIYPSLNFGTIKYSKKVIQELKHPQGSFFSISSHVDEGYNSAWDEKPHGPLLQKMIEGIIGIDKLTIAQMSDIEEPLDKHFAKLDQPVKEMEPCPRLVKMDMSGVWSNPADVSKLQGPSFEKVIAEDLVNKAKHQLIQNRRERILKAAEVLGEDIQVDHYLLQDNIKVFRQHSDILSMIDVQEDTPEWVLVMIAACRTPEFINSLKGNGFSTIQLVRYAFNDLSPTKITDTYYLFDTTYSEKIEAFIPRFIDSNSLTVDLKATEQTGEEVQKFTEQVLSWSRSKDR